MTAVSAVHDHMTTWEMDLSGGQGQILTFKRTTILNSSEHLITSQKGQNAALTEYLMTVTLWTVNSSQLQMERCSAANRKPNAKWLTVWVVGARITTLKVTVN